MTTEIEMTIEGRYPFYRAIVERDGKLWIGPWRVGRPLAERDALNHPR